MGQSRQAIFVCMTSYQYIVADLMAKKKYRSDKVKSLIILKYISNINFKRNKYADYVVIPKRIAGRILTLWYSTRIGFDWGKSILYFFNDRDPISKNVARWCYKKVHVEEGFAAYFDDPGVKAIGEEIIPDVAYVGYPDLYKLMHSYDCVVKRFDYKSFFNRDDTDVYVTKFGQESFNVDLVLLGQAVTEELRSYDKAVLSIIRRIKPDIKVIIKPHPRDLHPENYRLYGNVRIMDKQYSALPIEVLIHRINAKCLVTLFSSAVVTLSNMFRNMDIIMVYKTRGLELGEMASNMDYFTKYAQNIHIPSNDAEFEAVLNSVINYE